MVSLPQVAHTLETALTTLPEADVAASGFCRRRSKLTPLVFVQLLVLGWWQAPAASLGQLCQMAALRGVTMTPQGLDQRFTAAGAHLLRVCLDTVVQQVITAKPVAHGLLDRFPAVLLLDSTTITLPDFLAPLWPGCGGRTTTNTQAALKVTVRLDLRQGLHLECTSGRTQDRATALQAAPVPRGALRIADLGFWSLPVFRRIAAGGGYFLSRYHSQTSVWCGGQRLDLPRWLAAQGTPVIDVAVALGKAEPVPVRLLVIRVPPAVAAQRRRRIKAAARSGGHAVPKQTRALAAWTLLVTNAPAERLSVEEAEVLRRMRWQIELLFKLWKQHGQLACSRSAKPWRILCEVYAKLIVVLLQHGVLRLGGWAFGTRNLVEAAALIRAAGGRIAATLDHPRRLMAVLRDLRPALAAVRAAPKRRGAPSAAQLLDDPSLLALA